MKPTGKKCMAKDIIPINVVKQSIETLKPHLAFIFNLITYTLWSISRFLKIEHHLNQ